MDGILDRKFGNGAPIAGRAVTWADLAGSGLINLNLGGVRFNPPAGQTPWADPIPQPSRPERPHQPTGFVGYGAQTTIILTWDATRYAGHAFTEVYKGSGSTFSTAVFAGRTNSRTYADRVGAAASFYYWIRHVNELGEAGPFTAVGLQVASGTASPGNTQIANDLLVADKGIIVEALIGDAEIGGAKIRDASIESAKIVSLAANKITAGAISVGSFIQSAGYVPGANGWHINGNGNAEFMNVNIRANLAAGSTITAPIINGGTINSATINSNVINASTIIGGAIHGVNVHASNFWGSVLVSNDGSKWLAFEGLGGLILNTPTAKIFTDGSTQFTNLVYTNSWVTGLAVGATQWTAGAPNTDWGGGA
jgi:hypothetical protein